MQKRAVLIAVMVLSLGTVTLCLCITGIVAVRYVPPLMTQVGVAERYTSDLSLVAPASLAINNPNGDIILRAGDVQQIQVQATKITHSLTEALARRALGQVVIRMNDDEHQRRIDITLPNHLLAPDARVNLILTVPRDTSLDILAQRGDIHVSLPPDARFALDAQTQRGRIECGFPLTDPNLERRDTGDGEQWLKGHTQAGEGSRLTLRTGTGDIIIEPLR